MRACTTFSSSSAASPARLRTISVTGKNVIPSPYDRQRPCATVAPNERAATSCASRVLPTPAAPKTVTSRHDCSSSAVRYAACRTSRSGPRPDQRRVETPEDPFCAGPHLVEAPAADRLALALERERLERAGADAVGDQPVRLAAEQDLARLRRLLEARRDVDRVAGRDRLLGGRVADDDFARVDPDSLLEPDAEVLFELRVEPRRARAASRRPPGLRAARRPRGRPGRRRRPSPRRR